MPIINERDLQGSTLRGEEHGATISLILDNSDPGEGPRLHRHPYEEVWVVERGKVTFQVGEESQQAVRVDPAAAVASPAADSRRNRRR